MVEHIGSGRGNFGSGLDGSRLMELMVAPAKSVDFVDENELFVVAVQASVPLNTRSRQVVENSEYWTNMLCLL